MPATRGIINTTDMFRKRSRKLTSISLILSRRLGIIDDHRKKLTGVVKKAKTDVIAVNVTDKATCPFANMEKKLEAFPPGQAATRIIPSAIPSDGFRIRINTIVNAGSKMYCEKIPVNKAFF